MQVYLSISSEDQPPRKFKLGRFSGSDPEPVHFSSLAHASSTPITIQLFHGSGKYFRDVLGAHTLFELPIPTIARRDGGGGGGGGGLESPMRERDIYFSQGPHSDVFRMRVGMHHTAHPTRLVLDSATILHRGENNTSSTAPQAEEVRARVEFAACPSSVGKGPANMYNLGVARVKELTPLRTSFVNFTTCTNFYIRLYLHKDLSTWSRVKHCPSTYLGWERKHCAAVQFLPVMEYTANILNCPSLSSFPSLPDLVRALPKQYAERVYTQATKEVMGATLQTTSSALSSPSSIPPDSSLSLFSKSSAHLDLPQRQVQHPCSVSSLPWSIEVIKLLRALLREEFALVMIVNDDPKQVQLVLPGHGGNASLSASLPSLTMQSRRSLLASYMCTCCRPSTLAVRSRSLMRHGKKAMEEHSNEKLELTGENKKERMEDDRMELKEDEEKEEKGEKEEGKGEGHAPKYLLDISISRDSFDAASLSAAGMIMDESGEIVDEIDSQDYEEEEEEEEEEKGEGGDEVTDRWSERNEITEEEEEEEGEENSSEGISDAEETAGTTETDSAGMDIVGKKKKKKKKGKPLRVRSDDVSAFSNVTEGNEV